MVKRFRKTMPGQVGEVWVDLGWFRFRAELYENGESVDHKTGSRLRDQEMQIHLGGRTFSTLLRIGPGSDIHCTWSR